MMVVVVDWSRAEASDLAGRRSCFIDFSLLVGVAMGLDPDGNFDVPTVGKRLRTSFAASRLFGLGSSLERDTSRFQRRSHRISRARALPWRINFFDLLQMLRWSLMGRPVDAEPWFIGVGWAVVLLVGGFVFFWRDELSSGTRGDGQARIIGSQRRDHVPRLPQAGLRRCRSRGLVSRARRSSLQASMRCAMFRLTSPRVRRGDHRPQRCRQVDGSARPRRPA